MNIYLFVVCALPCKKLYKDCCTITYIFIIYEISIRKINHSLVEQVPRHGYTITPSQNTFFNIIHPFISPSRDTIHLI